MQSGQARADVPIRGLDSTLPLRDDFLRGEWQKRSPRCAGIPCVGVAYHFGAADLEISHAAGRHIGIEFWTERFDSQAACLLWGSETTNATQRWGRSGGLRLHWDS
jgi:hypothetical protein